MIPVDCDTDPRGRCWKVYLDTRFRILDPAGAETRLRSRKARAILAYLALAPSHAVSREELTQILWSNRGREQGRASLRQCLSDLRGAGRDLIAVSEGHIALRADVDRSSKSLTSPDLLWLDLDGVDPAFDAWLSDLRQSGRLEELARRVRLHAAVADPAPSSVSLGSAFDGDRLRAWLVIGCVALVTISAGLVAVHSLMFGRGPGPAVLYIEPVSASEPALQTFADLAGDGLRAAAPPLKSIVRPGLVRPRTGTPWPRTAPDYVVGGQVRRGVGGTILRISVDDPAGGRRLWSETLATAPTPEALRIRAQRRMGAVLACVLGDVRRKGGGPDAEAALFNACAAPVSDDQAATVSAFRAFVRLQPRDAYGHARLAMALVRSSAAAPPDMSRRVAAEAEAEARRALTLDQKGAYAYGALAQLALQRHDYVSAEQALRRAVIADSADAGLQTDLAEFLLNVGRIDDSLAASARAASLAPASLEGQVSYAQILADDDQSRAARAMIDALIKIYPEDRSLEFVRFSMTLRNGDAAGAQALLDGMVRTPDVLEPGEADLMRRQILATGRPDSAEALVSTTARRAQLAAEPDSEAAASQLEMSLAQSGRIDEAVYVASHHRIATWILFRPINREVIRKVRFPDVASRQGLLLYWRTTRAWPDVCAQTGRAWTCA